jgi:hypothetical protein
MSSGLNSTSQGQTRLETSRNNASTVQIITINSNCIIFITECHRDPRPCIQSNPLSSEWTRNAVKEELTPSLKKHGSCARGTHADSRSTFGPLTSLRGTVAGGWGLDLSVSPLPLSVPHGVIHYFHVPPISLESLAQPEACRKALSSMCCCSMPMTTRYQPLSGISSSNLKQDG